jgi:ribonuclease VapC
VNEPVIDASALLALLNREHGEEAVAEAVARGATISTVNLSEVAAKLVDAGASEELIRRAIGALGLEIVPFDAELAYAAGMLRAATRAAGLSLGDRACLALAQHLGSEALTCDRTWSSLQLGATVRMVR